MKVLVTGIAGFIGFHTSLRLLREGFEVYGVDNINQYYDTQLKYDRLKELGIDKSESSIKLLECQSKKHKNLRFKKLDIVNDYELEKLFKVENFDKVCHLAAQAGVRYSITHPRPYIDSNIIGFFNILECCRNFQVENLIYASSSSVYGKNKKVPFAIEDRVDNPISLYAATKKSNELMAYTYNHLYGFGTIGLRFFTVYGPWGRPDMAIYLFTDSIIKRKPIRIFNHGNLERDFTYVDDIVDGILKIIKRVNCRVNDLYNIGNSKPIKIIDFVKEIENNLNINALVDFEEMQAGDVEKTWSDISRTKNDFDYYPKINIKEGIKFYINWFVKYYT